MNESKPKPVVLAYLSASITNDAGAQWALFHQRTVIAHKLDALYGLNYELDEYIDMGRSASAAQREQLEALQSRILSSEADVLIVATASRLTRSKADLSFISRMVEMCGMKLIIAK
jgi:DNA invertase Pin-like site-specific DNA recombinase